MKCWLCQRRKATTTYGFPVCQPCRDACVELDVELRRMEAADPELKKIADRIDDMETHLHGGLSSYGIRERSVRRMRKARMKWRSP